MADLHDRVCASPYRVVGDARPAAEPLVFYDVPEAVRLQATKSGADVLLLFSF